MEIFKAKDNDLLKVSLSGRLDTNSAPELEKSIKDELEGVKKLVLNLFNLDYISSAGLRVILMLHKSMKASGGSLLISHPKDEVMEVFDMTGFSSFLVFEE
ncbi:MAG: STAS domain-containing protein [Acholeplasmatales bacterium]|nr:STAS domain-containing protein [Acholeplasmatales bacterium]